MEAALVQRAKRFKPTRKLKVAMTLCQGTLDSMSRLACKATFTHERRFDHATLPKPRHPPLLIRLAVLMAALPRHACSARSALFRVDAVSTGLAAYALAILPALPVIGVFWAVMRLLVEEPDEYLRMLLVRQALVATGFCLTIMTIWEFLQNFDLVAARQWRLRRGLLLVRRAWRRRALQPADGRHGGRLPMNNRLKVLRAERDWSQSDLAERLEVSRQSVNAIETGKYDPSLPLAFRIAELFDLADRGDLPSADQGLIAATTRNAIDDGGFIGAIAGPRRREQGVST